MRAHRHGDQAEGDVGERLEAVKCLVVEEVQPRLAEQDTGQDLPSDAGQPDAAGAGAGRDPDRDDHGQREQRARVPDGVAQRAMGRSYSASIACRATPRGCRARPLS